MLRRHRQAITFMGAIYRNYVDLAAEAGPAPVTAAAKPIAARQLTTPITATFLVARRLTRCAKTAVLLVSISDSPWPGN